MPWGFELYLLVQHFLFLSNYTVVLPTANEYMLSLGGSSWLAGLAMAVGIGSGFLTMPFAPCIIKRAYKTPLYLLTVFAFAGNALYGLGQVLRSPWLLVVGQGTKCVVFGCSGNALANHAVYSCAGPKFRSSSTALRANVQSLGMGFGPFFGALLTKIDLRAGALTLNAYTSPGWFYSLAWLAMLAWLLFVPEPARLFEEGPAAGGAGQTSSDPEAAKRMPDSKISWGLLAVAATTVAGALWEVSTSTIAQQYFGWNLMSSCLFIGAVFMFGMVSGEIVRAASRRLSVNEADIVLSGLFGLVLSSLMLYWYVPAVAPAGIVVGNQVLHAIGSILVITCVNAARSYCMTIAMRRAAMRSKACKETANLGVAFGMAIGRALGAFLGMGLAALPGGCNLAAACITGLSLLVLIPVAAPTFFKQLRSA